MSKSAAPTASEGIACCWTMVTSTLAHRLSHSAVLCATTCGMSFCRFTSICTRSLSEAERKGASAVGKNSLSGLHGRCIVLFVGKRTNERTQRSDNSEKEISVTLLGAEKPCKIRIFRADFKDGHKSIIRNMICLCNRLYYENFALLQKRDAVTKSY